jgi:RNA polymerase-binding transcription factor DksA
MSTSQTTDRTTCVLCGRPIAPGRLQALPGVTSCIQCAKHNPPKKLLDRDVDLSQSSPINRNGFAPSD